MPYFGTTSRRRLASCHPVWHDILMEAIAIYDFSILCGFRGEDEQNAAYALGNSKARWPDSKHNTFPSLAVDVAPYHPAQPHIRWDDEKEFFFQAGLITGIASQLGHTVKWGGRFRSVKDLPHFELIL